MDTNIARSDESLVWGAAAIGAVLNLPPRKANYQLEKGHIEGARKFGRLWAVPHNVLRRIANGEPR